MTAEVYIEKETKPVALKSHNMHVVEKKSRLTFSSITLAFCR